MALQRQVAPLAFALLVFASEMNSEKSHLIEKELWIGLPAFLWRFAKLHSGYSHL